MKIWNLPCGPERNAVETVADCKRIRPATSGRGFQLNLRKGVARSGDSKTSFTYKVDGKGRVVRASDSNGGEYEYACDKKGRIAKKIKADAEKRTTVTTYKYGANDRLKSEAIEGTSYKGDSYSNGVTYQYGREGPLMPAGLLSSGKPPRPKLGRRRPGLLARRRR